ncbi:MAG: transcription termination/antitermination NusG family protein [Limisphaerales bacterium]
MGKLDSDSASSSLGETGWFCVRSHPKREHIAAAHLRMVPEVEVFCPRLKVKKATRRGLVTFIESLFPNYLFARFDSKRLLDKVKHSPSVSTIVHFGNKMPMVPDEVILDLRSGFPEDEIIDCDRHVEAGDEVTIGEGPFAGMKATVLRVMTPYQRVEVLLEMLGRVTPVIINPGVLVAENSRRI